jgi:hypothetical protein
MLEQVLLQVINRILLSEFFLYTYFFGSTNIRQECDLFQILNDYVRDPDPWNRRTQLRIPLRIRMTESFYFLK